MKRLGFLLLLCLWLGQSHLATGALLYSRSDTLSTSAIAVQATHDIVFRNPTTIPVSGKIVFTPTPGEFTIPTGLHYRDVDLLINGTQQPLNSLPGSGGGSPHGVNVITGTNGAIALTLNDSTSIAADSTIELIIGPNAVYELAGVLGITNPNSIGSRLVTVHTEDNVGTPLDAGGIGLAITIPVGITGDNADAIADTPLIHPLSGTYTGNVVVTISTSTIGASIHYTTDGTPPSGLSALYTGSFSINQNTTVKAIAIKSGLVDSAVATATYFISNSSIGTTPPGEGGYIPPVGGTSINGSIGGTVAGRCDTGATISLLFPPGSWPGVGLVQLSCLPWSSFEPKTGAPTNTQAVADTIFSIGVTTSSGEPILHSLQPVTITISYTPGQRQTLSGNITAFNFNPKLFWRTTDGNIRNQPLERFYITTNRLETITLLGQPLRMACADLPADLNCDGRVNSTDLSILMYYWGSVRQGLKADINKDGVVNLVDFSSLLYWWTN